MFTCMQNIKVLSLETAEILLNSHYNSLTQECPVAQRLGRLPAEPECFCCLSSIPGSGSQGCQVFRMQIRLPKTILTTYEEKVPDEELYMGTLDKWQICQ